MQLCRRKRVVMKRAPGGKFRNPNRHPARSSRPVETEWPLANMDSEELLALARQSEDLSRKLRYVEAYLTLELALRRMRREATARREADGVGSQCRWVGLS